jgi:hypothetical protein
VGGFAEVCRLTCLIVVTVAAAMTTPNTMPNAAKTIRGLNAASYTQTQTTIYPAHAIIQSGRVAFGQEFRVAYARHRWRDVRQGLLSCRSFRFRTGYSTETETTPDRIMPRARAALSDTSMTRP